MNSGVSVASEYDYVLTLRIELPAVCRLSDNSNFFNLANVNSIRYEAKNPNKCHRLTACVLQGASMVYIAHFKI